MFPHSRRKYKLRTLGFSSRFQREQFSSSCLPYSWGPYLSPSLSCGPSPFSNFFRSLSFNYQPAHSSHLCITVTSVKYKGFFEVTGMWTPLFHSLYPLPSKYNWLVLLASNQRCLFQMDSAEIATAKAQQFMNLKMLTRMHTIVFKSF